MDLVSEVEEGFFAAVAGLESDLDVDLEPLAELAERCFLEVEVFPVLVVLLASDDGAAVSDVEDILLVLVLEVDALEP